MSGDRFALRARQIKALYQRELTAVHRDPKLDAAARATREAILWQETAARLADLERQALQEGEGDLSEETRALLAPPRRPGAGGE